MRQGSGWSRAGATSWVASRCLLLWEEGRMAFEKYIKNRRLGRPTASLWLRGQIGFNCAAVQQFHLADYQHAILLFEQETQRIGLDFTHETSTPGTIALTCGKTGACVSAKLFLQYHHIDYRETRKYPIDFDDAVGLYIIDLKESLP